MYYNPSYCYQPTYVPLDIHKRDSITGAGLFGAVFELIASNGAVYKGITNPIGLLRFCILPCNSYILREVSPPTGYEPMNKVYNICADGCGRIYINGCFTPFFIITNTAISASFTAIKINIENDEPLAGAHYTLFSGAFPISSAVSTDTGAVTFTNLSPGIYQLVETVPPVGFQNYTGSLTVIVAPNRNVTINGQPANGFRLPDVPLTAELIFPKLDVSTGLPLAGAVFQLSQNSVVVGTATSGSDGIVNFGVLSAGTYELRETAAPPGFLPNDRVYQVIVSAEGSITVDGVNMDDFRVEDVPAQQTELEAIKFSNRPSPTRVGDIITYTVEAMNIGNAAAYDVSVNDTPANGVELIAGSVVDNNGNTRPYEVIGNVLRVPFIDLAEGSTDEVSFQVVVLGSSLGQSIENTGTVTASSVPGGPTNLTTDFTDGNAALVEAAQQTVLEAIKFSDRPSPTFVGDTVTYTISVTNAGIANAFNVTVNEILAEGVELIAGSVVNRLGNPLPYEVVGNVLSVLLGVLPQGFSDDVVFRVMVTESAFDQSIENTGTVTGSSVPGGPPDLTVDFSDGNTEPVVQPVLEVIKFSNRPSPTRVGDIITYTVEVTNIGNATAFGTVMNDILAEGVELIEGEVRDREGNERPYEVIGNVLRVPSFNLSEFGLDGMSFQVIVLGSALGQSIENTGTVTASSVQGGPTNLTVDFTDENDTLVEAAQQTTLESLKFSDRLFPTRVGDTITYTIYAANTGIANAFNVTVNDILANGVELIPGSVADQYGTPLTYEVVGNVLSVQLGILPPGFSMDVVFRIAVLGSALGQSIENIGTVTGASVPGGPADLTVDFTDGNDTPVEPVLILD